MRRSADGSRRTWQDDLEKISIIPHARARARRVVPISELLFGTLTQNQSSLEPSLGFAAIPGMPRTVAA
jgi:hypothetical protein